MLQIGELINKREKVLKSERSQIIKEIYDIYSCPQQQELRRIKNFQSYIEWCKERRKYPHDAFEQQNFKRHKRYIKQLPAKVMAIQLSVFKDLKDLYYIKSLFVDRNSRNQPVGSFLWKKIGK